MPGVHGSLKERLELGLISIPDEKQALMAAIAHKEGSARLLLQIAYDCIRLDNYEHEFILSKLKEFQGEELREFVTKNINVTERNILREFLYLKEKNGKSISSRDLYNNFNKDGVSLSKSTISNALTHFESKLGIIDTTEQNLGGKVGRIRLISMDEDIFKILNQLEL